MESERSIEVIEVITTKMLFFFKKTQLLTLVLVFQQNYRIKILRVQNLLMFCGSSGQRFKFSKDFTLWYDTVYSIQQSTSQFTFTLNVYPKLSIYHRKTLLLLRVKWVEKIFFPQYCDLLLQPLLTTFDLF